jgi:hypothetical protein
VSLLPFFHPVCNPLQPGVPLPLDPSRKNVVIIGDSLTIGYTPVVAELLADIALVQVGDLLLLTHRLTRRWLVCLLEHWLPLACLLVGALAHPALACLLVGALAPTALACLLVGALAPTGLTSLLAH